jgi:hypothetical protein
VSHVEFPKLTPEAWAAFEAFCRVVQTPPLPVTHERIYLAAFLREAIQQARDQYGILCVNKLQAIADNLHSPPPPPPPTLAEAREADLNTPAGRDVVRDFLATLCGEVGQL